MITLDLKHARSQLQLGDWQSLVAMEGETLQLHPDRAKLALLVAAGHLQQGHADVARHFIRLAQDWGCSPELLARVLISGVYNTLGRAAISAGQQDRALPHFERAIAIGIPDRDTRQLAQARMAQQSRQLGLLDQALTADETAVPDLAPRGPSQSMGLLAEAIQSQKAEIEAELKKQSDTLISVRNFLESTIKKELQNATKQIEAFVAIQNYLNTGDLPQDMHGWPISPDFAQYLIELLEINDYDLVIEFGSGVSTVLMGRVLSRKMKRRQGRPPVVQVAFEHLEQFHRQTLARLEQAGLAGVVRLVHAPLQPYQAPNGKQYDYYACHETLEQLASAQTAARCLRVLVLVDGPPAATGKHARYPALPAVMAHFGSARIDFLMDDYIRDDEKEIVALWQQELKAANLFCTSTSRKLEKDACLVAISSSLK